MLKKIIFLFSFCLIIVDFLYAQKIPQIRKLDTTNAFNKKKKNYRLSALYEGNDPTNPILIGATGSDINEILNFIKVKSKGKPVTLFDYMYTNDKGILVKSDTIPKAFEKNLNIKKKKPRPTYNEIQFLANQKFVSGTLYFVGSSYVNPIKVDLAKTNEVKIYFNRLTTNDKVVCEKCIYKNDDGTLSIPISKTYKIMD